MLALPQYSAKDAAITQRPTSTSLLAIDSEDRYKSYDQSRAAPTSPYSFSITKNESIMNGFFTRLGVTEVCFPWVVPNIHNLSDSMGVQYGPAGGPYAVTDITLNNGFYTPSELAAAIETAVQALDASLAGFTMTYGVFDDGIGNVNQIPVFQYDTGAAVNIAFTPLPTNSIVSGKIVLPTTKQLFDLLGFTAGNSIPSIEDHGGVTYAQSIRYIDIVCSQLTNNQSLKDTMSQEIARDTLCRLYLGEAPGALNNVAASSPDFCPAGCAPFTLYRQFSTPKMIQWIPNQPVPGSLKFEVFDDTGRSLADYISVGNISKNLTDWSLTLLVTEN